jgi:hypothetical protein
MRKIKLTTIRRPNSLSIRKWERYLKIMKVKSNFQVRDNEKINKLEQNKAKGNSNNSV